jgi:uncharacterized damage-inducible protein DinB
LYPKCRWCANIRIQTSTAKPERRFAGQLSYTDLMLIYGAKDLAGAFRTVRKNTVTIAEEIPEAQYGFRAAPDTRTVAQMLVHVAMLPTIQTKIHSERLTTLAGFDFPGFMQGVLAEEQKKRGKAEIVAMVRDSGEKFAHWLEGLSDDFLGQTVAMPPGMTPESKTRFEMLTSVKEHEMHHRAQLMLIERIVGIVPHLTREMQARIAAMQSAQPQAKAQG